MLFWLLVGVGVLVGLVVLVVGVFIGRGGAGVL